MERGGKGDRSESGGEQTDKPDTNQWIDLAGGMSPDEMLMSPEWDSHLQRMREEDEAEEKGILLSEAELLAGSDPEESQVPKEEGVLHPSEQREGRDSRPVVWDRANRKHLVDDHPERKISVAEVEEALNDTSARQEYDEERAAFKVLGCTQAGRPLLVVWVVDARGRYPIHAHQAGRRTLRSWNQ